MKNKKKILIFCILLILSGLIYFYILLKTNNFEMDENKINNWPYNIINFHTIKLKKKIDPIKVAVIDTGIDKSQSCIHEINIKEYKISNNEDIDTRHGTLTMGALCKSKILWSLDKDYNPILKDIQFYSIDIGSDKKSTITDLKKGIQLAIQLNVQIINISMGTYKEDKELKNIVESAQKKGVIMVAAAGNNMTKQSVYPASYPGVISVGALNKEGGFTYTSNFGDYITLSAPGEEISTGVLDNDNQELKHSGTSGASTIVTSAAILIKMLNYDLSGNEIKNIFEKTSKNKGIRRHDKHYGWGILDIEATILYAEKNQSAVKEID